MPAHIVQGTVLAGLWLMYIISYYFYGLKSTGTYL